MTYKATLDRLTEISSRYKTQTRFLGRIRHFFTEVGEGAFRVAFEANDEWVFKITKPHSEYEDWSDEEVANSNFEEFLNYDHIKKVHPLMAAMILEPHHHSLPNGRDVVFMRQAVPLLSAVGCIRSFHPHVVKRIQLIRSIFKDTHNGNIGYIGNPKKADCEVYLIDCNLGDYDRLGEDHVKELLEVA